MTREEAAEILDGRNIVDMPQYLKALRVAADAFCEDMRRGEWQEPNPPLTLEKLREMDGEPVWVVESPDWGHWELSEDADDYVQDRDTDFYGMKHDDPHGKYGLHALGWLAYRRRPKEGTEHGQNE